MPAWLDDARGALADIGVAVCGVATGGPWDAVLPGARSAVVFGSGGRALWDAAVARCRAEPSWPGASNPIDALVREALAALPTAPDRRWVRCAADADLHLDFTGLALAAGLGHRGRIGLLLHPTHGPWLGLRAACFTTERLAPAPPPGPGPCPTCAAPCTPACPAGAVSERGLDLAACLAWQRSTTTCAGGCLARLSCPEGRADAYGPLQHRYHHHPPSRRAALAAAAAGEEAP